MKYDLQDLESLSQEEIEARNANRARVSAAITTVGVLLVLTAITAFFLIRAVG